MLRNRRRSLYREREMENKTAAKDVPKVNKTAMKLKMSPFPEVKGVPLKETNRLNRLSDVKASLQFECDSKCLEASAGESSLHSHNALSDSNSNSKREKPSIVKPSVEYVKPDIPKSMASEKSEVKLACFPPPRSSVESTLKPSSVQRLERHVTSKNYGDVSSGNGREGAASISSVWDSVVSWMKHAVDFVTEEAEPTTPGPVQGKKRPHPSDRDQSIPGCKAAKLTNQRAASNGRSGNRQSKRNSKRMSFGGFQTRRSEGLADLLSNNKLPPISEIESPNSTKTDIKTPSPTDMLTNQFTDTLSVKSPPTLNPVLNPALLKFTSQRLQSTNNGLNSILDPSPVAVVPCKKKKIRRQSLSLYYGNSVDSPNLREVPGELITVRRSPRLANKRTPPSMVPPPPPPPPPLPPTPQAQAPPPPPTPKIPSMYDCDLNDTPTRSGVDQSRALLQKMQTRLRTRMKRTAVGGLQEKGRGKQLNPVDIKTRQWAEIQSLSRKIPVPQFLAMAEDKKKQIKLALEELQLKVPQTMAGISETVELLQDGSQWFSGGVKEMRDSLPLYKALEKKVELLNEFTQLCSQMCDSRLLELPEGMHYSELHTTLAHLRSEFDSKNRYWGPVILNNAQSWQEVGLPVCPWLLLRAREHVCQLVGIFIKYTLKEAGKIEAIHLSSKCVRTKQITERLRESLQLMTDARAYFQTPASTESCPGCDFCSPTTNTPTNVAAEDCDVSTLLKYILDVSLSFIRIALGQFEGYVSKSKRQDVCEHFESVLKVNNLVKSLVCEVHNTKPSRVKTTGVVPLIPGGEPLSNEIYRSCVMLIQHILGQTGSCGEHSISPCSKEKLSKEVILWMMFGCKYVHQTLEVLGSERANARGVANLLGELQQMEDLLPN